MMIIDDKGRFVSGDKLMSIFAQQLSVGKVITVVDASMVINEMGFDVIRTKVGDPYVSDELRKGGDFGGEPSGSWIFPKKSLCPDGIYAAALAAYIASQQKISLLVDNIPSYSLIRGSIKGENVISFELKRRLNELRPLSIDSIDGTKLNFEDGWVLIRPSGTEPKIRITAEAKTSERANLLYNQCMKIVQQCLI
jgi:phosphoglucosamine mutase